MFFLSKILPKQTSNLLICFYVGISCTPTQIAMIQFLVKTQIIMYKHSGKTPHICQLGICEKNFFLQLITAFQLQASYLKHSLFVLNNCFFTAIAEYASACLFSQWTPTTLIKRLPHRCFPKNFAKLRAPFQQKIWKRLLLNRTVNQNFCLLLKTCKFDRHQSGYCSRCKRQISKKDAANCLAKMTQCCSNYF